MEGFTEGPWKVVDMHEGRPFQKGWKVIQQAVPFNRFGGCRTIVGPSAYESSVYGTVNGVHINDADAALIAAAPDMHAAVEAAVTELTVLLEEVTVDDLAVRLREIRYTLQNSISPKGGEPGENNA